jgi:hypothetical protein
VRKYLPKQDCGGKLKHLGDDVSEILEYVPASLKVIQHIRPKLPCACCDRIAQAETPSRPIERGIAGPGLLAHALVSKYCASLSSIADLCSPRRGVGSLNLGGVGRRIQPAARATGRSVVAPRDGCGETTRGWHASSGVGPRVGQEENGRLWTCVRDDRPAGDSTPDAVWFAYSPDRKGEHP